MQGIIGMALRKPQELKRFSLLSLSLLSATTVFAQHTQDTADQTPRFILDTVVVTAVRVGRAGN